jgi:hypothetical protein
VIPSSAGTAHNQYPVDIISESRRPHFCDSFFFISLTMSAKSG